MKDAHISHCGVKCTQLCIKLTHNDSKLQRQVHTFLFFLFFFFMVRWFYCSCSEFTDGKYHLITDISIINQIQCINKKRERERRGCC